MRASIKFKNNLIRENQPAKPEMKKYRKLNCINKVIIKNIKCDSLHGKLF